MKVLIADGMPQKAVEMMKGAGLEVDLRKGIAADELLSIIPNYEVLCVRSATKVTAQVIDVAKKLKVIGRAGVGVDNIDCVKAGQKGIKVINTPYATVESVAELVIGMMLAVSRFIAEADATIKAGLWEKKRMEGVELGGKTLGVIGGGSIGRAVLTRARALGMNVIATEQKGAPAVEELKKIGVPVISFDELLQRSDYISVHVPLLEATRHFINAETFKKMKKGVFFINCARGGIVNEKDLADAVRSGQVAGAGVDVYEEEPIKRNPFEGLARVIQTPHLGGSTAEGQTRAGVQLAEQIIAELEK